MSRGGGVLSRLIEAVAGSLRRGADGTSGRGEPDLPVATWREDPRAGPARSRADLDADGTRDLRTDEIRSLRPSYSPLLDGEPDPGEVVWTWVPYVENDGRGKDRPVLIIASLSDGAFAGCYLSTKQHRGFVPVGTGPWDPQGRESFLSPERLLRVTDGGMRRETMGLDRAAFDRAVAAVVRSHRIPL
ncbi:hypothetical protein J4H92_07850 [Leucobacter weissii]|uniref:Type II toxin-antitoxin system PemK/MazF family toxin n=1 Tax=Leucobacter weissii TaxID=1983706 RepID=A0A939ML03_9MICO|nr:hypothetical protein [Leucobacter weissii]MBO1901860.1 hypothetical protein [Leucobacter weissii]